MLTRKPGFLPPNAVISTVDGFVTFSLVSSSQYRKGKGLLPPGFKLYLLWQVISDSQHSPRVLDLFRIPKAGGILKLPSTHTLLRVKFPSQFHPDIIDYSNLHIF